MYLLKSTVNKFSREDFYIGILKKKFLDYIIFDVASLHGMKGNTKLRQL